MINGLARGADQMAVDWADAHDIWVEGYPAQWTQQGRAAGPIRNQQMLDEGRPELVLAFHDNLDESKGTKDMVTRARKAGITVLHYYHTLKVRVLE
jgi:hypothetical protein